MIEVSTFNNYREALSDVIAHAPFGETIIKVQKEAVSEETFRDSAYRRGFVFSEEKTEFDSISETRSVEYIDSTTYSPYKVLLTYFHDPLSKVALIRVVKR